MSWAMQLGHLDCDAPSALHRMADYHIRRIERVTSWEIRLEKINLEVYTE